MTTELPKPAELFLALTRGVTLSAMLATNRMGTLVLPSKGPKHSGQ